jgi:hypothetical protein
MDSNGGESGRMVVLLILATATAFALILTAAYLYAIWLS